MVMAYLLVLAQACCDHRSVFPTHPGGRIERWAAAESGGAL